MLPHVSHRSPLQDGEDFKVGRLREHVKRRDLPKVIARKSRAEHRKISQERLEIAREISHGLGTSR